MLKVNFGCGENKLHGWKNHDAEIDITNALPYEDKAVSFILAEHVVEHVRYREAVVFMQECHRILVPGGVLRIIMPSVERIMKYADNSYIKFVSRWSQFPDLRGAMGAIMWEHGHKVAWTESLMRATLFYAGFDNIKDAPARHSSHPELHDVYGHWKVIGQHNNEIESVVLEATKQQHKPEGVQANG